MRPLRYSLAGLLGFTLFIGFTCAALRYQTDLWASAAVSFSGLLLLLGALAAILPPPARPFWTGFAVLGLAYLYFSIGSSDSAVRSHLLTTHLLHYVEEKSSEPSSMRAAAIDALILRRLTLQSLAQAAPLSNFESIGHSAVAILIGLFGGVAGGLLASNSTRSATAIIK